MIVLTKLDLYPDLLGLLSELRALAPCVGVHPVSSETGAGFDELDCYLEPGQTICLLGSSGVGKSTLANRLLGYNHLRNGQERRNGAGRHTTTHRELVCLPGGGLLIDNPGMREVGLWAAEDGVEETFDDVASLAGGCRFDDCATPPSRTARCRRRCSTESCAKSGSRASTSWRRNFGDRTDTGVKASGLRADDQRMTSAPTTAPERHPTSGARSPSARRLFFALAFAAVTVGACVLLGRRFTHTSWPLQRAHMGLVAATIALYFASFVLRALGWQKLFPSAGRPGRARCLAACGPPPPAGLCSRSGSTTW